MADTLDNDDEYTDGVQSEALLEIAARIAAGDRAAEGELVQHTRFGLWMVLVKRGCSKDEAEDLAQEALIVALRRLRAGELEDPSRISGYLLRTALYMQRGAQRRLSESRTVYEVEKVDQFADEKADPLAHLDRSERQDLLRRALSWLSQPRDRELLHRHYLLEEDKSEVCAKLDLSVEHFDRVLHRAKQRLAKLMKPFTQ